MSPAALRGASWFGSSREAVAQPIAQLNTADASVQHLSPSDFFPVGGRVFFIGQGKGAGAELWSTDGTTGGTDLVRDVAVGLGDGVPYYRAFAELQGKLLFAAAEGNTGLEVWGTDGTTAGTQKVTALPGFSGVAGIVTDRRDRLLVAFGGSIYFCGSSDGFASQLWKLDAAADGGASVVTTASGRRSPGSPAPREFRLSCPTPGRGRRISPPPRPALQPGTSCG